MAQTGVPDGIIFQAVATDPQGNPAANRTIYIKDAILQTTATGTVVYSETFQVTASSTGVFTIVIGKGQRLSGPTSISNLDWSAGPYFLNLKAAVAPSLPLTNWNVDQQYVDMGTSQFWTVPFAMYASKVAGFDLKLNIADTSNMLNPYLRKIDTAAISSRIDATKLAVTQEIARATAAEALKANATDVTASLALKANINNPTFTGTVGGITKSMVGLANADNTSDVNKPISTATQTALDLKANTADVTTSLALKANINNPTFTGTVGGITKSMVGLGNVDNTSDVNKPVSTATQTALNFKEDLSNKSTTTSLGTSDILYPTQNAVKTYVDAKVIAATPDADATTKGKIQLAGDLGGTASSPTVPGLATKANTTDVTTSLELKAPIDNPTFTGTVSGITKGMVGLGNVDNTSDVNKPVSTATQTALNLKEDLTNKSTTTTLGSSDVLYPTQKAVKTYVDAQIASAAISIGAIGSSNANGASLTSGVLRLSPADGTNSGIVTTGAQSIAGAKTFLAAPILSTATASQALFTDANKNIISNAITGSGNVVMSTSPTLVTPALGTPSALVGTNITGTAAGLNIGGNAATVTTNANLTGVVTSIGNATSIANGAISNAMLSNGAVANLSGTNTGDNAVNSLYNGLISNATHTGDVTGSTALTIANNAVTTNKILDANVTTAKIADGNITTAKILDANVTDAKIATVSAAKITGVLPVANGGTGSSTQNFVDLTTAQTIAGAKTFSAAPVLSTATASQALFTDANKNIISNAITGSGNVVMSTSPTLTGTITAANQNLSGTLGIGTISPNGSAALDISSTTKGFLPPRMTTSERDAITGLVEGLTVWNTTNKQLEVYDGSYWVNMLGKLVSTLKVGQSYGGGKIAYIFTSSDPGYIAGQTHGLIAASSDQTTDAGVKWFPTTGFYGATAISLGQGSFNTVSIIAAAGTVTLSSYAAGLANSYRDGSYTDWYLPSKDELDKLYQNRAAIGGFATTGYPTYWSSSQKGSINLTNFTEFAKGVTSAWVQFFFSSGGNSEGTQADLGNSNTRRVRAIRTF